MTGLISILLAQETPASDEIYDILVLAPEKAIWPTVFFLTLGFLLLAGIGAGIWYWVRSRKKTSEIESAITKANRQLRDLSQQHDELDPNRFSLALSETLKDFIVATFADPVRFETTQEFLSRIARTGTTLPPAAQQELEKFLMASEEVKFGNVPDAAERTQPLLHRAKTIVDLCQSVSSASRKSP